MKACVMGLENCMNMRVCRVAILSNPPATKCFANKNVTPPQQQTTSHKNRGNKHPKEKLALPSNVWQRGTKRSPGRRKRSGSKTCKNCSYNRANERNDNKINLKLPKTKPQNTTKKQKVNPQFVCQSYLRKLIAIYVFKRSHS